MLELLSLSLTFYLNEKLISTNESPNAILLDFIRYTQNLKGTKIGCREGDCGACTVLIGSINSKEELEYKSVTSCLTPLGNIANKHVVTIEGINDPKIEVLTPIQASFVENGATQCGFCTPGFIMSATGHFLKGNRMADSGLYDSLDGNICRCTGYKSIERACNSITKNLNLELQMGINIPVLVQQHIIPEYFLTIKEKLKKLTQLDGSKKNNLDSEQKKVFLGGGTDLMVQKSDEILISNVEFVSTDSFISEHDNFIEIAGSTTTEEFFLSESLNSMVKGLSSYRR